ncbi:MAG: sodium/proline symporter PutP [Streptosporangiales bacterium]|nr:sodium/proline symporter PutP [Streptosporangiales bacterium]
MSEEASYTTTLVIYFAAMLFIGGWCYRKNRNLSDYVLGGRSLNYYVTALSAMASDLSAWLLLGLPGAAYAAGLGSSWIIIGLFVGLYANWRLIAGRLRDYSQRATDFSSGEQGDALTLSAYFENRFEDRTHLLRLVSAVVIIVFFTVYVASGMVAGGVFFENVFDADPTLGVVVTGGVVVAYTFVGGFLAVSYTDSVQALIMWVAVLGVPIVALALIGGFGPLADAVSARSPELLSVMGDVSFADGQWTAAGTVSVVAIISGLAWGFGYLGQPHILARFMGIKSAAEIPKARRIGVTYGVTGMSAALALGLFGIAYFDEPLANPESVFIRLVRDIIPIGIAGVFLVGVLAAIMSTASSQLLVAASSLSEDVYRRFFRREATGRHLLWVSRFIVLGVAVVAFLLALRGGSVLDIVAYAWAGFGASFGMVLLTSLFWRKMNRVGALAGMIGGGATVLIYPQFDTIGLYEMVPGVAVSLLCIFVFNRLGVAATAQMQEDFDDIASRQGKREPVGSS